MQAWHKKPKESRKLRNCSTSKDYGHCPGEKKNKYLDKLLNEWLKKKKSTASSLFS